MNKLLCATVFSALFALAVVTPAHAETYGGDATGAQITVPATGTTIRAATGTLPISGGAEEASLLVGDVPGSVTGGVVALTAGVMHSSIVGIGSLTTAESSMGDVGLTVSGNQITADFIMARSQAGCSPNPSVGGKSELVNLVVNGQPISVTGQPNQTVSLPNGTVVINQEISSIVGTTAELSVHALRVTTRDALGNQLADVILSRADAKHGCEEQPPANAVKTTGGGWIPGLLGGKATFGLHGDVKDGAPRGHVVFKDQSVDFSMQSTSIDTVSTTGCTTTITGTANSNRGVVTFRVDVTDAGEPGTADTFGIEVHGAFEYFREPTPLGGGNIQVHGNSCP